MKSNNHPYPSRNGGAKDSYALAEPDWWADDVGSHFAHELITAQLTREMQFPDNVFSWPVERLSSGERQRLGLARALTL